MARGAAGAQWEPWHFSGCGSLREENSWVSAGPLGQGRKFWLLVIQITDMNSEERDRLEVGQSEEAEMRQTV